MVMNFYRIAVNVLIAGRREDAIRKYPDKVKEIDYLLTNSPSKYLNWQLRMIDGEYVSEQMLANIVKKFESHKDKIKNKDINSYDDYEELLNELETLEVERTMKERGRDKYSIKEDVDADIVYESDKFICRSIHNQAAATLYGGYTKWCITSVDNDSFGDYNQPDTFIFYIETKNVPVVDRKNFPFYKICLELRFDESDFMDLRSKPIDPSPILFVWHDALNKTKHESDVRNYLEEEYDNIMTGINSYFAKMFKSAREWVRPV